MRQNFEIDIGISHNADKVSAAGTQIRLRWSHLRVTLSHLARTYYCRRLLTSRLCNPSLGRTFTPVASQSLMEMGEIDIPFLCYVKAGFYDCPPSMLISLMMVSLSKKLLNHDKI